MSDGLSRFGISEFTTWPRSFEWDLEHYARHGVAAIEICEFKLNRENYAPQLQAIQACGLAVSSVQSYVHSIFPDSLAPQPSEPEDRIRHIESAIERIAPHVPAHTPFVVITGAAPGGDTLRVYERCLSAFEELASFAARFGVRMAFEPLNPVLFNTDTALWGLGEALRLVERVGHPALGLCVDTWNVFQSPHLAETIAACGERIFVVQVSDWSLPRSGADRRNLLEGSIDHAPILAALRTAGYRGHYVLEIFSGESLPGSIWRSDLDRTIELNRNAFSEIWKQSEPV